MSCALEDLRLERLIVLYPGTDEYRLAERVLVCPIARIADPVRFERLLR